MGLRGKVRSCLSSPGHQKRHQSTTHAAPCLATRRSLKHIALDHVWCQPTQVFVDCKREIGHSYCVGPVLTYVQDLDVGS